MSRTTHTTVAALLKYLLPLSFIALLLSGCMSMEPMQIQGDPVQRYEGDGFTMRLEFLDEAYLRARYGQRDNTFIAPPGLTAERFLVFELDVDTERALRIDLTSIELQIGGSVANAQNRFNFGQHWRMLHENDGRDEIVSIRRQEEIDATVLPNRLTLVPGQGESGLLVFRGRFPRYGSARIYVPVLDGGGRPFERAEFAFEF